MDHGTRSMSDFHIGFVIFPDLTQLDDWLVTVAAKDVVVTSLRARESPWAPAWYEDADDLGEFQRT